MKMNRATVTFPPSVMSLSTRQAPIGGGDGGVGLPKNICIKINNAG